MPTALSMHCGRSATRLGGRSASIGLSEAREGGASAVENQSVDARARTRAHLSHDGVHLLVRDELVLSKPGDEPGFFVEAAHGDARASSGTSARLSDVRPIWSAAQRRFVETAHGDWTGTVFFSAARVDDSRRVVS